MHRICQALILVASIAFSQASAAQDYPNKPILLVVPFAPGGVQNPMATR
jgi:tripartite-type tricarboxylate transporter receptor subunit TctC